MFHLLRLHTDNDQCERTPLTSIAPNGNAYVVKKGKKHGDKFELRWNESSIILDTPENRKVIAEIEAEGEKEWKAEATQKRLQEKLKYLDGQKAYKAVYGKEL